MKSKGFTIIELIIVIAIISVLVIVATPLITGRSNGDYTASPVPAKSQVVPDMPVQSSATKCEKVSDSADGAVHRCPDGTVLLVK